MQKKNWHPIDSYLADVLESLLSPPEAIKTVSFGKFDEVTNGFRPHEFTILCGQTGIGKTTFLANISRALMQRQIPQLVASVETGPHDYFRRVISCIAEEDWNRGNPVDHEKVLKFKSEQMDMVKKSNLFVMPYEGRIKTEVLLDELRQAVNEDGVKIIMLDNLNFFLETTSQDNLLVEMDRVTHKFIMLVKELPVHLIMVMHPRKTINGRVESIYDIKGSSTAVQEAHNVFLLNRVHEELVKQFIEIDPNDRELYVGKMRRFGGATGWRIVFKALEGVTYRERGRFVTKS